ncbi:lactosylceramide 4-alpha-galactosyltransferase-like [Amphibalanus amphitrite]|uniref:lactosylceramide 4-alpha-galactosyltransferase-like n=1 Tax=Amphibalanus amphitrite TaxID=1232801 RepID=UPI001C91E909|nr:lactosylceramide 4-alpha-galactosyltransferase-like [Amphibalanus amphitrite]
MTVSDPHSHTLALLRRRCAMVAPCAGGGGKRRRALLLLVSATVALLLFYAFYPASQDLTHVFYPTADPDQLSDLYYSWETHTPHGLPAPPRYPVWIQATPLPPITPDRTIFLLETSGRSEIRPREWCAVESAARAHPGYTVLFLTATARVRRTALAAAVLAFNNTRLAQLDFAEVFEGTLLEEWYRSRAVLRSWWQASHMSDALRFALLTKYGGIYLDTDVIVRRSMADMDDGAGLESEHSVAAGVLKFARRSALPGLLAARFVEQYDPGDWGANGPGVVTAVLLQRCGIGGLPLPPSHCGDFTIFGSRRFYGVPWPEWRLLLTPAQRDTVLERVDASYVVHTWGLHISGHSAPPGSALYQLAEQHCPLALAASGSRF